LAELRFAGVRKDYGPVRALRGLDLEVADGELLVLVGPSGCGKSTALRTAAGLEDVTEGSIHIGGHDVTRVPPARRNVSMVFQSYALFPHLTVEENIGFGLRARKVPRGEARGRSRTAAELVGCGDLLERKPFELSGGERQRVALARALVRDPDVFLLDEPRSNLAAQLRVQMRAELKRLHQRVGATMVYVTHDQVEALTLGDRVAVLQDGVIQQLDLPDEIYRGPANRFVARFIGSPAMNLFAAQVAERTIQAGPFVFERSVLNGLPEPAEVEVGIRPENVRVEREGAGAPVEVQVVEVAGNETFLHLGGDGTELIARIQSDLRPELGSTVKVRAEPKDLYFFDAATGRSLR
jgi:multiple sugar transport system ATP-binding protein